MLNTDISSQSRRLATKISLCIDSALDLIPQRIRKGAEGAGRKVFMGLAVGIVFLYAATNRERSFIHQ